VRELSGTDITLTVSSFWY